MVRGMEYNSLWITSHMVCSCTLRAEDRVSSKPGRTNGGRALWKLWTSETTTTTCLVTALVFILQVLPHQHRISLLQMLLLLLPGWTVSRLMTLLLRARLADTVYAVATNDSTMARR